MGYVKRRDMKKAGGARRGGAGTRSMLSMAMASMAAMASSGVPMAALGWRPRREKYAGQGRAYLKGAWRGGGVRSVVGTKAERDLRRLEHRRTVAEVAAEREALDATDVQRLDATTAEFVRRFHRARRSPYTPRWMGGVLVSPAPGSDRVNRRVRRSRRRSFVCDWGADGMRELWDGVEVKRG